MTTRHLKKKKKKYREIINQNALKAKALILLNTDRV